MPDPCSFTLGAKPRRSDRGRRSGTIAQGRRSPAGRWAIANIRARICRCSCLTLFSSRLSGMCRLSIVARIYYLVWRRFLVGVPMKSIKSTSSASFLAFYLQPTAKSGFDGTWQPHAEDPGKRYFLRFMRIIAGEGGLGVTTQEAVRSPISPGPMYRRSARSFEERG